MMTYLIQIENTRLTWRSYRSDSIPDIASMQAMRGVEAVSVAAIVQEAEDTPSGLYAVIEPVESWSRPLYRL